MRGGRGSWIMSGISALLALVAFGGGSKLAGILLVLSCICFLGHIFSDEEQMRRYAIITAVIFLIIGFVVYSHNDNTVDIDDSDKNNTSQNEVQQKKNRKSKVFEVGDKVQAGKCEVTLVKADRFTPEEVNYTPKEGNIIIGLYFVVYNTSDIYASSGNLQCYVDNNPVNPLEDTRDTNFPMNQFVPDKSLSPGLITGRKEEGYVFYEIPEKCKSMEIEHKNASYQSGEVIVCFKVI